MHPLFSSIDLTIPTRYPNLLVNFLTVNEGLVDSGDLKLCGFLRHHEQTSKERDLKREVLLAGAVTQFVTQNGETDYMATKKVVVAVMK